MRIALVRAAIVLGLSANLMCLLATPAQASVAGSCWSTGYASQHPGTAQDIIDQGKQPDSGVTNADLASVQAWQVPQADTVVVQAGAGHAQHHLSGAVVLFGVPFDLLTTHGSADTGYSGPWDLSQIAPLVRRVGLSARSDNCGGTVVLETDRSPLLTAAGGGGLLLVLIGLLLAIAVALRHPSPRVARRVLAWPPAVGAGLLAGIGAGSWMQQAGALSPLDRRTLLLPLAGLLLGAAAATVGEMRATLHHLAPPSAARNPLRLPAALVAGVLVVALVACTGFASIGGSLSDQVITKDQARVITLSAWAAARKARAAHDQAGVGPLFSGEARAWAQDVAVATDEADTGMMSHGLQIDSMLVPHRSGYPADFVVTARVNMSIGKQAKPGQLFMLFTRASPSEGWTATAVDAEPGDVSLPRQALDDQGYLQEMTPSRLRQAVLAPDQAASKYTQYYSQGVAQGRPPTSSPFAAGRYTSDLVKQAVHNMLTDQQVGFHTVLKYASPTVQRVYPLADGGLLVFQSFDELDSLTPSRPDQCFSFKDSPFLPTGNLKQATLKYAGVAMLVVPAKGAQERLVQVVGHDTYYTGASTQVC
jgi:hypothetical protein